MLVQPKQKTDRQTPIRFLFLLVYGRDLSFVNLGNEHDERCSLGSFYERVLWTMKRAKTRAVVEKIEEKRKPDKFFRVTTSWRVSDNPEVKPNIA